MSLNCFLPVLTVHPFLSFLPYDCEDVSADRVSCSMHYMQLVDHVLAGIFDHFGV